MSAAPGEAEATRSRPVLPAPLDNLVVLVVLLLGAVFLREVASLVVPLLFGVFLALVAWPMVGALERRALPRSAALGLTILIVLVVVLGAALLVGLSIGELVVLLPRYEGRLDGVIASVRAQLAELGIEADPQALLAIISPEQIASVVRSLASTLSSAGLAVLVIILTMAYALAGGASLEYRARGAFGRDHGLLLGVSRFGVDLRRYLWVRALLGVFAAVLVFVLLFVIGVPLPALWAFLVFAASFVPNVGVIIALVPPTVLALLDGGVGAAGLVVVGYLAINFIQDNFLQPIVLGSELNLSPTVVFVGVIVWAWIFGAAGALLAVPMTVGLVSILEASPSSRPIAVLLRNQVDEPAGFAAGADS
jgi:predicted PurR-regulated permease PerM